MPWGVMLPAEQNTAFRSVKSGSASTLGGNVNAPKISAPTMLWGAGAALLVLLYLLRKKR